MRVRDGGGRKAKAIVWFAEARIIAAANELIDRRAMAIGRIKIPARIQMHAKWIHLPPGKLLHTRAIRANAVGVSGLQIDAASIATAHGSVVVEAMRHVQPAIKPAREAGVHPVRVAFEAERAIEFLTAIRTTVVVSVPQKPDVRNAPDNRTIAIRIYAGRDVQPIGERGDLVRATVAVGILQHLHRIPPFRARLGGVRIFQRRCHPQPPTRIEG